jgi:hypothetical protein
VRPPQAFELVSVDFGWRGPTLWRSQYDHRPARPCGNSSASSFLLKGPDSLNAVVESCRQGLVHRVRIGSLHKAGRIPVAFEQVFQFLVADAASSVGLLIL